MATRFGFIRMSPGRIRESFLAAFSLALLLAGGPVAAQIGFQVEPGLSAYARVRRWSGARVEVTNGGPPQRVAVSVVRDHDRGLVHRLPERLLPSGSVRREWLYSFIERDAFNPPRYRVHVERSTPQEFTAPPVRWVPDRDWLVVAIGPGSEAVLTIANVWAPLGRGSEESMTGGYPRRGMTRGRPVAPSGVIHVVPLPVELVPDRWLGLDVADAIVLGAIAPGELTPEQEGAIRDWVLRGGHLVVLGGHDATRLKTSFFAELLPVTVVGTTSLALPGSWRDGPRGWAPGIATLPKPGAEVLRVVGNEPIAAYARYGAGRVTFVAYDPQAPTFATWPGARAFWLERLDVAPAPGIFPRAGHSIVLDRAAGERDGREGIGTVPLAARVMDPPPVGLVALFLAAYFLCLGPLNQYLLRRWDRRDLAWLSLPAIVGFFALLALGVAYASRGMGWSVVQTGVIEGELNRPGLAYTGAIGIFSPRPTRCRVTVDGRHALNPPGGEPALHQPAGEFVPGDPFVIEGLPTEQWGMTLLGSQGILAGERPLLRGSIEGHPDRPVVSLTNESSYSLRNVAVIVGSEIGFVGDLRPGHSGRVESWQPRVFPLQLREILQPPLRLAHGEERLARPLLHAADATIMRDVAGPFRVTIVGWLEGAPLDVRIGGRAPRESAGLYLFVCHGPRWP